MTRPPGLRPAGLALIAAALGAPAAQAQAFSPHLETTGRGAYDLYRDTLLCNAVLERAIGAAPDGGQRPQLEQGLGYTAGFALFLLESGNVVDGAGTLLTPDNLPADRRQARAAWQAVLASPGGDGDAEETEIARCLLHYGHDWD